MKKIASRLKQNLLVCTSLCSFSFLSPYLATAQPTLLDILAQDGVALKKRTIRLKFDCPVKEGPSDNYAYNAQSKLKVRKDPAGHFLCYPMPLPMTLDEHLWGLPQRYQMQSLRTFSSSFDVVHTFGTVSYASSLHADDMCQLYNVRTSSVPLALYPHDERGCNNAYFSPEGTGSLHFLSARTPSPDLRTGRETCRGTQHGWTCQSFDIPTHEYGHAELHKHRPGFISSWRPETGALHEAYGDLKVVFTGLSLPSLRRQVLCATGGDLHNSSFLADIGEEFGHILGQGQHGIRSVNNDLGIGDIDCEVHSLSRVFSGAVYDVLASSFEARQNSFWSYFGLEHDDDTLLQLVGKDLRRLTLKAFITVPSESPTFKEVGRAMHRIAENIPQWTYLADHIEPCFSQRGIDISSYATGLTRCDMEVLKKARRGQDISKNLCVTVNKLWPLERRKKAARIKSY